MRRLSPLLTDYWIAAGLVLTFAGCALIGAAAVAGVSR